MALNKFIMRDNETFHKYKVGLEYINSRIDKELARQANLKAEEAAQRLMAAEAEKNKRILLERNRLEEERRKREMQECSF